MDLDGFVDRYAAGVGCDVVAQLLDRHALEGVVLAGVGLDLRLHEADVLLEDGVAGALIASRSAPRVCCRPRRAPGSSMYSIAWFFMSAPAVAEVLQRLAVEIDVSAPMVYFFCARSSAPHPRVRNGAWVSGVPNSGLDAVRLELLVLVPEAFGVGDGRLLAGLGIVLPVRHDVGGVDAEIA